MKLQDTDVIEILSSISMNLIVAAGFWVDYLDNKESKELDKYGHFDILDTPWANLIHNTISKGSSSRENDNIKS